MASWSLGVLEREKNSVGGAAREVFRQFGGVK